MPAPRSRVTLTQVAKHANVSRMTASYAYNQPGRVSEESKRRVFDAARQLGYAGPDPSARSLRRGSAGAIGVALGERLTYAFDDPQATAFLAGVSEVCARNALALTILPISDAPTDHDRIRVAAVDGYIFWTTYDDSPLIDAALATQRPVVVHGGPRVDGAQLVSIDNHAAAQTIGRIGLTESTSPIVLSFPVSAERRAATVQARQLDEVTFPVTRDRLHGFRAAAVEKGLNWDDMSVIACSHNDAAEAQARLNALLESGVQPDAILAMSDELAAGAMRALQAADVSQFVAITGWDDSAIAAQLGITTVKQSLRQQGAMCARVAIEGASVNEPSAWDIVERESTNHQRK